LAFLEVALPSATSNFKLLHQSPSSADIDKSVATTPGVSVLSEHYHQYLSHFVEP